MLNCFFSRSISRPFLGYFFILALFFGVMSPTSALSQDGKSTGQLIYVPAYSHVLIGPKPMPFALATTLMVRNLDQKTPITVASIQYLNSEGKQVKSFLEAPVSVPPLGSYEVMVEEQDSTGGYGPSFLILWNAEKSVRPPLTEAVMIGSASTQGISFVMHGHALEEVK